jgi:hypothetical protein
MNSTSLNNTEENEENPFEKARKLLSMGDISTQRVSPTTQQAEIVRTSIEAPTTEEATTESPFDRARNLLSSLEPQKAQQAPQMGVEQQLDQDKGILIGGEAIEEKEDWFNAFKQGIAQPLEAISDTADVFGFKGTSEFLKSVSPEVDDEYISAGYRFMNPKDDDFSILGFAPEYLPRAVFEQFGQITGSILSSLAGKVAGAAVGTAVAGPKGTIVGGVTGALTAPFLFEAIQIAGPTIKERAKNNGREEPELDDIIVGLKTAAASGALNAIATKFLPGGDKAAGSVVEKVTKGFASEGITETLQSLTQQTGETLLTEEGFEVSPKEAIGEGLIGAGTGGVAAGIAAPLTGKAEAEEVVEKELPKPEIEEEKRGRVIVQTAKMKSKLEAMEAAARKAEEARQQELPLPTTEDEAKQSAKERLNERSRDLEQKNIPNEAVKIVEAQLEEEEVVPETPAVKTVEDVINERAEELDKPDVKAIEIDEITFNELRNAVRNRATGEEVNNLKKKGLAYEVEGELVITEPARLAMGAEAAPLSEKARLEGIRDRFNITNAELNNSTDNELAAGIRVTQSIIPRLPENLKPKATREVNKLRTELLRRSRTPVESPAGRRAVVDNNTLLGFGDADAATVYVANRVDGELKAGRSIDLVNPITNKVSKVTGFDTANRKLKIQDPTTNKESSLPISFLLDGNGRLELFNPKESRSLTEAEIQPTVERKFEPLELTETEVVATRPPVELKSTPLEGFSPIEDAPVKQEAQRKAEVLQSKNATKPVEFLTKVAKEGGVKGKVADLLMKMGNIGQTTVNIGRYGRTADVNKRFAGRYNRDTNEIFINLDERDGYTDADGNHDVEATLLHELSHAVFANKLANTESLNSAEAKAVRELEAVYDKFVEKYSDSGLTGNTANALKNLQEFTSEVLVNPEVQALVNNLTPDKSLLQKVLQNIINFIRGETLNPYNELSRAFKALNTLAPTPAAEAEVAPTAEAEVTPTEEAPAVAEEEVVTEEEAETQSVPVADELVLNSPISLLPSKIASFVKSAPETKYTVTTPKTWITKLLGTGDRSMGVQRALELMEAKLKKFLYGVSVLDGRLRRAAKTDKIKYDDVKEVTEKALISKTNALSLEQIQEANQFGEEAGIDAVEKWLDRNANRDQQEFEFVERPEDARELLSDEQKARLESLKNRVANKARKIKEQELLDQNYNRALAEAEVALQSLPENLRNVVLDVRAELEQLLGDAVRNGVISPGAKVNIAGKETDITIEELFWIKDNQKFAEQLKTDPEVMNRLIKSFQDIYINNRASEILRDSTTSMSNKQAREIAASEISDQQAETLAKSFINSAVNDPDKAFNDVLVKGLKLTPEQETAGLTKELKDILKKYGDASASYAQLVGNVAKQVAYTEGFTKMRDLGLSQGWILDKETYKGEIPPGYVEAEKITIPGFARVFKGYLIDPVFLKEMRNTFEKPAGLGGAIRWLVGLNGFSMAAQTALSAPRGHVRNFAGNLFMFIAGGKYEFSELAKEFDIVKAAAFRKGSEEALLKTKRAIELDVLDQTVDFAIIRDAISAAEEGAGPLSSLFTSNAFRKGMDVAGRLYNFGDNIWKLATWRLEQKTLTKAYAKGIPAKVAETDADIQPNTKEFTAKIEELAADRVKNYMISMSRMNALGRAFRKPGVQAIFASFIGFTSEVIRISHANVAMAMSDIKSGNATLKADGFRRLAGTVAAHSSVLIVAAMLKELMGIGDDEEDAARRTMPDWDKRATLIFWRNPDGTLSYFNTSFINPYAAISADPIRAFIKSWEENGDDGLSGFIQSTSEALSQAFGSYIEPQIFTKAVMESYSNKVGDRQVYNPEASVGKKFMDVGAHLGSALIPGSTRQARGLINAMSGEPDKQGRVPQIAPALVNFMFARSSNIQAENSFRNKMFEVNRRKRDASRLITGPIKTKGKISDSEIESAYNRANNSYRSVLMDAHTYYQDGITLGVSRNVLERNMSEAGLSGDDIRDIRRGYIRPYEVSPTTLRDIPIERRLALRKAQSDARARLARPTGALTDPKGLVRKE